MGLTEDRRTGVATTVPLAPARVLELAAEAARQSAGLSFRGGIVGYYRVVKVGTAAGGDTFEVLAPGGRCLLVYRVEATEAPDGRTEARVTLVDGQVSQAVTTFGIPLDRKRLDGFGAYQKFVETFTELLARRG
ncbi:MAG TPA: hypothetical protein VGD11_13250 [Mycobacteriales bacterium]|jgi:hypothetical protein